MFFPPPCCKDSSAYTSQRQLTCADCREFDEQACHMIERIVPALAPLLNRNISPNTPACQFVHRRDIAV